MITINKEFLVKGPISSNLIAEIINSANQSGIGAHSIFFGQVRGDLIKSQVVTGIEYSAYQEMVEPELQKIITIVTEKYNDLKKIYILHSTGLVKAGEISLLVFVGCGHRKQSFRAVEDIVELFKERIPIWKKELLDDKSHQWPENKKENN